MLNNHFLVKFSYSILCIWLLLEHKYLIFAHEVTKCRPLGQQQQGFILSLHWPPSYCADFPDFECSGANDWIIHGFWPISVLPTNETLEYCCHKQRYSLFFLIN